MTKRILALAASLLVAINVVAQQPFASRKTDIRAAYFQLSGNTLNAAPHAWFNLNQMGNVKPAGWDFANPLAPGVLTADQQAFFNTFLPGTPAVGTAVNKRAAAYWWLNIADMSDEDLDQIDVALVQISTPNLIVRPNERERLRRFVDKGGVLWVDYTYGSVDQTNSLPYAVRTGLDGASTPSVYDFRHPLTRYPFGMSQPEMALLGYGVDYAASALPKPWFLPVDLSTEGAGAVEPLMYNLIGALGESGRLRTIARAGANPTIMAGRIGDGYAIYTARGLSETLNRANGTVNRGFFAVESGVGASSRSAVEGNAVGKFVINMIALASDSTMSGTGSKKVNSSFIGPGGPLLQSWKYTFASPPVTDPNQSRPPVIYKGLVFFSTATQVVCVDTEPGADRDGDGNSDDGVNDGLSDRVDGVFRTAPVPGGISSAVCAEVPDAQGGAPRDQLMVTTTTGDLLIYPIFDATRRLSNSLVLAPVATLSVGAANLGAVPPSPPTIHEGIAYVSDSIQVSGTRIGRMWQASLRTLSVVQTTAAGNNNFVFGGATAPISQFSGAPTVGYIPIQDNSGGYDKVAYQALVPQVGSSPLNAGLVSLWLGARGERPSAVDANPGSLTITTRAATQSGLPIYVGNSADPLSFRVSVIQSNGVPLTAGQMASIFDGSRTHTQGVITLGLQVGVSWPPAGFTLNPENPIRIDYIIDWGAAFPAFSRNVERGRLFFPGNQTRSVVNGLALSGNGNLYATYSTKAMPPISGISNDYLGSLFAIREEGRGVFRMVYRWDLFPDHQFRTSAGIQPWGSVLPDNDPVQYLNLGGFNLNTILGGPLRSATFQGAPVVRNGEVYVTVSGTKGSGIRSSALLCFADETNSREVRIGRRFSGNAVIVQPDMARSSDPTRPTTFSTLGNTSFRVEREDGGVGALIRFDSMMSNPSSSIIDSVSTSQPIILREEGRPDEVIDPNANGSRWSPLKWYAMFHGTRIRSTAFVGGQTVYVTGEWQFPSILNNPTFVPQWDGFAAAINTDFDVTSARLASQSYTTNPVNFNAVQLVADDARPYMRQLVTIDYPRLNAAWNSEQQSLDTIYPNQQWIWPQSLRNSDERGRSSFDDFRIRLNQTLLRPDPSSGSENTNISYGVVGGDGTLVAWNARGLFGFRPSSLWVADEGRISQIDPAGNMLYDSTTNRSTNTSTSTGAVEVAKFGRPTRVYPVPGSGDVLVVDGDRNRIVRMTKTGLVRRSLLEFSAAPGFTPTGYRAGEPLTLDNPRDVSLTSTEVLAASNPIPGARPLEQWDSYSIADQGNNRIITVVDRYELDVTTGDLIGTIALGQVQSMSPAAVSGSGFNYNSVTRVEIAPGRTVLVAAISGKSTTPLDSGTLGSIPAPGENGDATSRASSTGNGSVIIIDPALPAGFRVFNQLSLPAVDFSRLWSFQLNTWETDTTKGVIPRVAGTSTGKFFSNLQSVTASTTAGVGGVPGIAIMVADGTGLYEAEIADVNNPVLGPVRWMLPDYAFRSMRRIFGTVSSDNGLMFQPTYARRLNDDSVIVVNGYNGSTVGNPVLGIASSRYRGEVLQLDGRVDTASGALLPLTADTGYTPFAFNLGFSVRSIQLRLGPVEGGRPLAMPVFADRR